jgi:hypothetical protein
MVDSWIVGPATLADGVGGKGSTLPSDFEGTSLSWAFPSLIDRDAASQPTAAAMATTDIEHQNRERMVVSPFLRLLSNSAGDVRSAYLPPALASIIFWIFSRLNEPP